MELCRASTECELLCKPMHSHDNFGLVKGSYRRSQLSKVFNSTSVYPA